MSGFFRRHRGKFMTLATFVGGGYLATQYLKSKLFEFTEKAALDRTAKDNMKKRFEQNQRDCVWTVLALLPELSLTLMDTYNVESLTLKLSSQQLDKTMKLETWNDIKTKSVIRAIASVYEVALLDILTHIQVNLVGKYYYMSSVQGIDEAQSLPTTVKGTETSDLDPQVERAYLLMSSYFLQTGRKQLVARIAQAVESVVSPLSLKQRFSWEDWVRMIQDIRNKIEWENGVAHDFTQYLLPKQYSEEETTLLGDIPSNHKVQLRHLLSSTHVIFLSGEGKVTEQDQEPQSDVNLVTRSVLDDMFDVFFTSLKSIFGQGIDLDSSMAMSSQASLDISQLPLASILPSLTRTAHIVMGGDGNEYLDRAEANVGLRALSAMVYAGF